MNSTDRNLECCAKKFLFSDFLVQDIFCIFLKWWGSIDLKGKAFSALIPSKSAIVHLTTFGISDLLILCSAQEDIKANPRFVINVCLFNLFCPCFSKFFECLRQLFIVTAFIIP